MIPWIHALIITPSLLGGMIETESGGNPRARSPKGAIGLMQVLPSTAQEMGYTKNEIHNPKMNVKIGIEYLSRMLDKKHLSLDQALSAYNTGPNTRHYNANYVSSVRRRQHALY